MVIASAVFDAVLAESLRAVLFIDTSRTDREDTLAAYIADVWARPSTAYATVPHMLVQTAAAHFVDVPVTRGSWTADWNSMGVNVTPAAIVQYKQSILTLAEIAHQGGRACWLVLCHEVLLRIRAEEMLGLLVTCQAENG